MKRAFLGFLAVAGFGCACAFGQGTTGTETVTITHDFVFPPVGLANSESAAVNLVNIAPVPATTTTTPVAAPSCTGTVTFANATGGAIGGKAIPFTVGSGDIATVSLPPGLVYTGAPARGLILASVQQTITWPSAAPCSLVFSLEVFDVTSGVTHVFLGNASATAPPLNPIIPILEPVR